MKKMERLEIMASLGNELQADETLSTHRILTMLGNNLKMMGLKIGVNFVMCNGIYCSASEEREEAYWLDLDRETITWDSNSMEFQVQTYEEMEKEIQM